MKNIRFSYKIKAALIIILLCFASARLCAQQYVYWTESTPGAGNTKIASVNTDGSDYSVITLTNNTFPQGLGIYSQYLYWNEMLPSGAKINQAYWSTVDVIQVLGALSGIRSIAIDDVNNKIYWTTSAVNDNKICRANTDGTGTEVLINFGTGSYNIRQIAIDVPGNKMYWADFTSGIIGKADLDGTNSSNLVTGGTGKGFTGVALDMVNGRLYWTEINTNVINSIKTDGTGQAAGFSTGLDRPQYITFNDGKIYWTETGNGSHNIKYASVNASGNISGLTILHSAVNPYGIVVGSSPSTLPVELTAFTAAAVGNSVELNWETASEINNYGFEIERTTLSPPLVKGEASDASEEGDWEKVGFVAGSGNSNSPKLYSYVDVNPVNGKAQYRLKQINTNGSFAYFNQIAEVNYLTDVNGRNNRVPTEFTLDQNYPNPFNPTTRIQYAVGSGSVGNNSQSSEQLITLKVYDILGNEVAVLVNEYKAPGYYEAEFDGSNLATGVYIYKLTAGEFTSAKKLILMK